MESMVVSSKYLTTLSKQMSEWKNDKLGSAIAAVPGDWTTEGIVGLSVGGAAALGVGGAAAYNYSAFTAKTFTVKGFSFTGEQALLAVNLAITGYAIYSDLSTGNYWAAALDMINLIPVGLNLASTRSGAKALFESAGGTTVVLERTGYCLMGLYYAAGLAKDIGEDFTDGNKQFSEGSAGLKKLMPTGQWTGTASSSYAEVVRQLQQLMGDMAEADAQMAEILQEEMDQLIITRNIISTARTLIQVAIPAAVALYAAPGAGPEVSQTFQAAVAATALIAALNAIGNQLNFCVSNGARVDSRKARYEAVQKRADELCAQLQSSPAGTSPSAGAESSVATSDGVESPGTAQNDVARGFVGAAASQSGVERRSASGSESRGSMNEGELAAASGGRPDGPAVIGGAPDDGIGSMSTVANMQSGSRGQTVSRGGKAQRPDAPASTDGGADADKTRAAETGPGAYPEASEGEAVAGRAPVDAGVSAPEEPRENSTISRTGESQQ